MAIMECLTCGWKGIGKVICPRCTAELQCEDGCHEFIGKTTRGNIYKQCRRCGYIEWIIERDHKNDPTDNKRS